MKRHALAALLALTALPALAQAPVLTQPYGVTSAQSVGTIATGGTFQTVLAASSNRKGCLIQNISTNTLYLFLGEGTPTTANSIQIASGGSLTCEFQGGAVLTDLIRGTTSTTNDTFIVVSQ